MTKSLVAELALVPQQHNFSVQSEFKNFFPTCQNFDSSSSISVLTALDTALDSACMQCGV